MLKEMPAGAEINISLEKLCYIIIKAREFDAKVVALEPDPGSNPSDDNVGAWLGRGDFAGADLEEARGLAQERHRRWSLPAASTWRARRTSSLSANSGTGKTHIALALGLAACQRGFSTLFITAHALAHQLM